MAQHRHKRDANARRTMPSAIQVAGPVAVLATLSAVAVGVMTSNPSIPGTDDLLASSSSAAAGISASSVAQRGDVVSRSERRQDARAEARQEARQDARQEARQQAERQRGPPGAAGHAQGRPERRHPALDDDRAQPVDERRRRRPQRRPRRGPREGPRDRPQGRRPRRGRRRWAVPVGDRRLPRRREARDRPVARRPVRQRLVRRRRQPLAVRDPRRGLRQLARDHVVRHLARRRRARRRAARSTSWSAATTGWDVAEFLRANYCRARHRATSSTPRRCGRSSGAARAGATCRTVAPRPPTTTTTSTSRSTDLNCASVSASPPRVERCERVAFGATLPHECTCDARTSCT